MNNLENDLIQTTKIFSEKFLEISDETAEIKKSADKWSRKEILGHLIDSAIVNYSRFMNAVSKDDLVFKTYPQDYWVELQNYNTRNWIELINLWKSLNLHSAELIKSIPQEKKSRLTNTHNFDKICFNLIEKNQESSLDYLINDYVEHLKHHIEQIINY